MERGDVSFTFLGRIQEIEWNIRDGRWQSALALALTLPDICGGIAYPEMVKRYRDGRVMLDRSGNPSRDVGSQYIAWFDRYAAPFFKRSETDAAPYLCGERCWQLRCEYLHQNKGFVNGEDGQTVQFHLGLNCGSSICQLNQAAKQGDGEHIRLDIEQMCTRLCQAAKRYYDTYRDTKDFSLYHTPVIDFVQWSRENESTPKTAAFVCQDSVLATGIQLALEQIHAELNIFATPAEARKHFGKGKPAIWIVAGSVLEQKDQPWRADKTTPVVLLKYPHTAASEPIQKQPGKVIELDLPVSLAELSDCILAHLS